MPFGFLKKRSKSGVSPGLPDKGESSRPDISPQWPSVESTSKAVYYTSETSRSAEQSTKAPPAYSERNETPRADKQEYKETPLADKQPAADDPYEFLGAFDTVFLIDDSGSMIGESWREVASALQAIVPICTKYDADGVDMYFLNKQDNSGQFRNITSSDAVQNIFRCVSPAGVTPTGQRLDDIMKPYIEKVEECKKRDMDSPKPLNIIVITDGKPTDDPETVIVKAAKRLDGVEAPLGQIGIQFFQVGKDGSAAASLMDLDDNLGKKHNIRDMVDTVPWKPETRLDANFILKVVTGAMNRRIDRRPV